MSTPQRFINAKYEDVPKQIKDLFEKMPETKKGIYLFGAVGTGKTHFCYGLKTKYDVAGQSAPDGTYRSGRSSMFWNMTELLREVRQDFDRPADDKTRTENRIMEFQNLVILDDVGAEKITDWVQETFYLIVNKRYNDMLPTIFTSNLNPQELSDRIGVRTVSRIVEMCEIIRLDGEDKRVSKKSAITIKV